MLCVNCTQIQGLERYVMTKTNSGPGHRCASVEDYAILTREEGVRLHTYLVELECTIDRLAEHIAELESTICTLENEQTIADVVEAGRAASAGLGGTSSPGAGATPRTTESPVVLFRFDPPSPPKSARPIRSEWTPQDARTSAERTERTDS